MKRLVLLLPLLALLSCAPPEREYCNSFGVLVGNPEYDKCVDYYHQQEALFGNDYGACSFEADKTYPPTLYDRGHTGYVRGYGPYYGFSHIERIDIEPDYAHNAQVDALRMRIIQPCMDARGWNSPTSWQAGRHAVNQSRRAAPTPLPWLQSPAPASGNALPWLKQ